MVRLLPLLLLVGCGLPSKDHVPGPALRSPEELLWAVERRHLDAGSVVIRTRIKLAGEDADVTASFRGDEHAHVSIGPMTFVGDGRRWGGASKGVALAHDAPPKAGENTLLYFVRTGFGGMILAKENPTGQPPEGVIKDLRFTDERDLVYTIDTKAGRMTHVLRIERQSLAIVERVVRLGDRTITETWNSVFDRDLPDSLFVVPEK